MPYLSKYYVLLLIAVFTIQGCGGSGGSSSNEPIQLDLPFSYNIGSTTLETNTAGGTVYVSVGSYGAHYLPFSGDPIGDAKANMAGWFVNNKSDLIELTGTGGNGDGVCDPGESCGFWGGMDGGEISNRTPTYISPMDAIVTRVTLNAGPDLSGFYFRNASHWEIELQLNSRFTLRIGHTSGIAPGLRDKILAATGINTDTYTGPPGPILVNGSIAVSAGEALSFPQLIAKEVASHPGYYRGGGIDFPPWAQMEFVITDHQESADVCVYDIMDATTKSAIQSVLDNDMANASSPRFAPYMSTKWVWGVEGVLCPSYSPNPVDFSNLHTRFGGWTERPESGTTIDERFAIVTINKSSSSYDSANYDSADVNHLASRTRGNASPFYSWTMPDSTVVSPIIPVGEVLEETTTSLLIKWRDIGWTGPAYQRASFILDSNGLKVKWGDFAADIPGTITPDLSPTEDCNAPGVICYDHTPRL